MKGLKKIIETINEYKLNDNFKELGFSISTHRTLLYCDVISVDSIISIQYDLNVDYNISCGDPLYLTGEDLYGLSDNEIGKLIKKELKMNYEKN